MTNENLPEGIFATNQSKEATQIQTEEKSYELKEIKQTDEAEDVAERKERRRNRIQRLKWNNWAVMMIVYMFPFVNLAECIYFLVTKKHPDAERWAKGALIPAVIISLLTLFVLLRLRNMTYSDCMKFVQMFQ